MKLFGHDVRDLFLSREFLLYFFSGVVTTLVHLGVFTLMSKVLGLSKWYYSLLPAIVISILVSYVLNRLWVFRSTASPWLEFVRFVSTRLIISLVFQYAGYYLVYDVIGFRAAIIPGKLTWAAVLALFFVIIGNYFAGKFYVFAKKPDADDEEDV